MMMNFIKSVGTYGKGYYSAQIIQPFPMSVIFYVEKPEGIPALIDLSETPLECVCLHSDKDRLTLHPDAMLNVKYMSILLKSLAKSE